jgi:hypothetical protein
MPECGTVRDRTHMYGRMYSTKAVRGFALAVQHSGKPSLR